MAKEIERKFLIDVDKWGQKGVPIEICQAYLVIGPDKVVRVRIAGKDAFLTIKGNLQGITRDEFEYSIPVEDAEQLMNLCVGIPVKKTRYIYRIGESKWEIDVFHCENEGLIVAEIELESENTVFNKPDWIIEEVSNENKYFNFNLSQSPFKEWK